MPFLYIELFLLYHLCRNTHITLYTRDVLIGHFRNDSNCMFYFHILPYKQGTSEAHFVAKWQHLLHSYQYNMYHIVWIFLHIRCMIHWLTLNVNRCCCSILKTLVTRRYFSLWEIYQIMINWVIMANGDLFKVIKIISKNF